MAGNAGTVAGTAAAPAAAPAVGAAVSTAAGGSVTLRVGFDDEVNVGLDDPGIIFEDVAPMLGVAVGCISAVLNSLGGGGRSSIFSRRIWIGEATGPVSFPAPPPSVTSSSRAFTIFE